ncbi:MAG TPA: DUF1289 domain-containing protein [Ramlibacter sp.]|jgi:hypothetical protein|nr:DUF1289 domain-containing protein [Ramlibacter sp.]
MNSARDLLLEKAQSLDEWPFLPSPCISVCRMNPDTGFCEGCWRTLDEIADWSRAGEERKREIWEQLVQRAQEP